MSVQAGHKTSLYHSSGNAVSETCETQKHYKQTIKFYVEAIRNTLNLRNGSSQLGL